MTNREARILVDLTSRLEIATAERRATRNPQERAHYDAVIRSVLPELSRLVSPDTAAVLAAQYTTGG